MELILESKRLTSELKGQEIEKRLVKKLEKIKKIQNNEKIKNIRKGDMCYGKICYGT